MGWYYLKVRCPCCGYVEGLGGEWQLPDGPETETAAAEDYRGRPEPAALAEFRNMSPWCSQAGGYVALGNADVWIRPLGVAPAFP